MPSAPIIYFNSAPGPKLVGPEAVGTAVTLSLADTAGVTSYQWTLVSAPVGSTTSLAATAAQPTLNPDRPGTYLVRVAVNGGGTGLEATAILAVTEVFDLTLLGRVPATSERTEAGASGWSAALAYLLRQALTGYGDSTRRAVVVPEAGLDAGVVASVDVWALSGYTTIAGVAVPTVVPADPTDATKTVALFLRPPAVSVVPGARTEMILSGPVAATYAGSPTVGDPVYVTAAGAVSLSPAATVRQIGRVLTSSGGAYRIHFNSLAKPDPVIPTVPKVPPVPAVLGAVVNTTVPRVVGALSLDPATDLNGSTVLSVVGSTSAGNVTVRVELFDMSDGSSKGYVDVSSVAPTRVLSSALSLGAGRRIYELRASVSGGVDPSALVSFVTFIPA